MYALVEPLVKRVLDKYEKRRELFLGRSDIGELLVENPIEGTGIRPAPADKLVRAIYWMLHSSGVDWVDIDYLKEHYESATVMPAWEDWLQDNPSTRIDPFVTWSASVFDRLGISETAQLQGMLSGVPGSIVWSSYHYEKFWHQVEEIIDAMTAWRWINHKVKYCNFGDPWDLPCLESTRGIGYANKPQTKDDAIQDAKDSATAIRHEGINCIASVEVAIETDYRAEFRMVHNRVIPSDLSGGAWDFENVPDTNISDVFFAYRTQDWLGYPYSTLGYGPAQNVPNVEDEYMCFVQTGAHYLDIGAPPLVIPNSDWAGPNYNTGYTVDGFHAIVVFDLEEPE